MIGYYIARNNDIIKKIINDDLSMTYITIIDNGDDNYIEYLKWIDEGNAPESADEGVKYV